MAACFNSIAVIFWFLQLLFSFVIYVTVPLTFSWLLSSAFIRTRWLSPGLIATWRDRLWSVLPSLLWWVISAIIFSFTMRLLFLSPVWVTVRATSSDHSSLWGTFPSVPYIFPHVTRTVSPDGAPGEGSHIAMPSIIIITEFSSVYGVWCITTSGQSFKSLQCNNNYITTQIYNAHIHMHTYTHTQVHKHTHKNTSTQTHTHTYHNSSTF